MRTTPELFAPLPYRQLDPAGQVRHEDGRAAQHGHEDDAALVRGAGVVARDSASHLAHAHGDFIFGEQHLG